MNKYTYIHTYIHTYIYIYIYTHTNLNPKPETRKPVWAGELEDVDIVLRPSIPNPKPETLNPKP